MHTRRARHDPAPAPAVAPAASPDPRAARIARWGGIAITIWYLAGFVVLVVGLVAGIGPANAVTGWMNRELGWDSPVLAFLPAFAVLALPVIVLQVMPLRTGDPFVRGAQLALAPSRDPARRRGRLPDAEAAAKLRRLGRVMLALAAGSILAGIAAFLAVASPPAQAGEPLPRSSPALLLAGAGVPPYARLAGLSARVRPLWVHIWSIRQTVYEDIYFPLDEPASPTGRTRLLGLASFVRGHGDVPHGREIVLEQPMDGSLSRTSLPAWQRAALAGRGIIVDDPVLLFRQDRSLHGRYPGRDWIGGTVVLICGGSGAFVFLVAAVSCIVRRRRLLAMMPTAAVTASK